MISSHLCLCLVRSISCPICCNTVSVRCNTSIVEAAPRQTNEEGGHLIPSPGLSRGERSTGPKSMRASKPPNPRHRRLACAARRLFPGPQSNTPSPLSQRGCRFSPWRPLDTAPEKTGPTRGERIFGSSSAGVEPNTPSSRLVAAAYRGAHLFIDTLQRGKDWFAMLRIGAIVTR
jgi:hypothetical protein